MVGVLFITPLYKEWLEQEEGLQYTVVCFPPLTYQFLLHINSSVLHLILPNLHKVRPAGLTNGPKTESEIQVISVKKSHTVFSIFQECIGFFVPGASSRISRADVARFYSPLC